MYRNLSLYPQLSRILSRRVARAIAMILILAITGVGSPVFARSMADGFTAAREQLPSLSSFVLALSIKNWFRSSATVTQNRGMPPDVSRSLGVRPEPPEHKSQREERVTRLELNLREGVTLKPGELVQLVAVPVDSEGNPVHGVTAEWRSPNSHVATISEGGEVTALAVGTAPITATAGQAHATLIVNVVPRASASGKESSAKNVRRITSGSPIRPQRTTRNSSSLFAHASGPAASVRPPIGMIEAEQLYEPNNAIGAPPGRTTPGASTPGSAIETTETPGSANFSFGIDVVRLPGRGFDLDFGLTYNSRLWTKSLSTPTQMTYNMDASWIAPGFIAGYGYLDDQSDGSGKQFMITDAQGTRRKMVNIPVGSNTYESDDGSFIKLTVNGSQVTPATAIFPGGMQIRYGIGDSALTTRYHPTQITDRNGNFNTIAYAGAGGTGPKIDSIKDTLARYVRFKYVGNDLIAITAPGMTGQPDRPVIRFYYENISGLNASGLFQSGIVVNAPSGGIARVVRYIYLANATESANAHIGYRYDYSSYGMMFKITKFHGMTISTAANDYTQAGMVTNEGTVAAQTTYNYQQTAANLSDAPFYTTRTDDWAGRTSPQPIYNFSVDQTAGLSTVTAPDGTITETQSIVHVGFPDDGLISRTTIKVGSTVWSEIAYSWDAAPPGTFSVF